MHPQQPPNPGKSGASTSGKMNDAREEQSGEPSNDFDSLQKVISLAQAKLLEIDLVLTSVDLGTFFNSTLRVGSDDEITLTEEQKKTLEGVVGLDHFYKELSEIVGEVSTQLKTIQEKKEVTEIELLDITDKIELASQTMRDMRELVSKELGVLRTAIVKEKQALQALEEKERQAALELKAKEDVDQKRNETINQRTSELREFITLCEEKVAYLEPNKENISIIMDVFKDDPTQEDYFFLREYLSKKNETVARVVDVVDEAKFERLPEKKEAVVVDDAKLRSLNSVLSQTRGVFKSFLEKNKFVELDVDGDTIIVPSELVKLKAFVDECKTITEYERNEEFDMAIKEAEELFNKACREAVNNTLSTCLKEFEGYERELKELEAKIQKEQKEQDDEAKEVTQEPASAGSDAVQEAAKTENPVSRAAAPALWRLALDDVFDRRDNDRSPRSLRHWVFFLPKEYPTKSGWRDGLMIFGAVLASPFLIVKWPVKLVLEWPFHMVEKALCQPGKSMWTRALGHVCGAFSSLVRYTFSFNPIQSAREAADPDARPSQRFGKKAGRIIGGLIGFATSLGGIGAAAFLAPAAVVGLVGAIGGPGAASAVVGALNTATGAIGLTGMGAEVGVVSAAMGVAPAGVALTTIYAAGVAVANGIPMIAEEKAVKVVPANDSVGSGDDKPFSEPEPPALERSYEEGSPNGSTVRILPVVARAPGVEAPPPAPGVEAPPALGVATPPAPEVVVPEVIAAPGNKQGRI